MGGPVGETSSQNIGVLLRRFKREKRTRSASAALTAKKSKPSAIAGNAPGSFIGAFDEAPAMRALPR